MRVLPLLSKVFERLLYYQFCEDSEKYLNAFLWSFWKAHSTQHALFKLFQAWKEELDESVYVGTILIDLSKVFY